MKKLIIDANATCHKVKHTLGALTNDGEGVGIIFGFLNQILSLAKTYDSNEFVFTWDSSKSLRREIYPPYKLKRTQLKDSKTPEEKEEDRIAYVQFQQLYKEILPAIGFRDNFKVEGYEGDDLIASIVNNNPGELLIVSGDEDMYQCLSDNVSIVNSKGLYTKKDFMDEYGIYPKEWIDVKAWAGCKSDEVEGVPLIGPKKAIAYINNTLPVTSKTFSVFMRADNIQIYKRNLQLVQLPFAGCPNIHIANYKLDFDAFLDICAKYNFQHFLKKEILAKWKQLVFYKED